MIVHSFPLLGDTAYNAHEESNYLLCKSEIGAIPFPAWNFESRSGDLFAPVEAKKNYKILHDGG